MIALIESLRDDKRRLIATEKFLQYTALTSGWHIDYSDKIHNATKKAVAGFDEIIKALEEQEQND